MNQTAILPDGVFIVNEPVKLPEVLDVLVVGGGPAGTSAAFHAKELGLSVLVIDYDDLMKRIRDYPKSKLILPDYGGGDKMQFPKGGDLISLLHFNPIDKDDMCKVWKDFYRKNNIPAQVGIELINLEDNDGIWKVKAWNHNLREEQYYMAKHVVIGIGRGVPRRFDIPGNTDGMAFRLDDAMNYVEGPVCVIGGGTSAAEAVISISNAKIQEGDKTPVYWAYRGDKMPRVSKALAEVFFEAYVGNGNIRYNPKSEPVAVITGEDRQDYLSIRIDYKQMDGRPCETTHLEFPKEKCIACIGEDIPEAFLNTMGIYLMQGGTGKKKRMAVTPFLETQQKNVYLTGDILSPIYLETDDFNADPAGFQEIKRRGNIKAALRDGVFVTEVIAQKLKGEKDIQVRMDFVEGESRENKKPKKGLTPSQKTAISPASPPPKEPETEKSSKGQQAYLVRILPGNVDENEFPVHHEGVTTIGSKECDVTIPDDTLLSHNHASIAHGKDGYFLRDDGGEGGVFLRAREGQPMEVTAGDLIRLGKQFLLFHNKGGSYSFSHYDQTGKEVNRHELTDKTIFVGRQAPDITLDSKDMTLSRRHLSIVVKEGKLFIKDLKSANGGYLKVKTAIKIEHDDKFRIGRQIFRLNLKEEISRESGHFIVEPAEPKPAPKVTPPKSTPKVAPPKPEKKSTPPKTGSMVVTFKNSGQSFPLKNGQTICELAEENDIKIVAECHAGVCGSDPIRILSGKENLSELTDDEKGTIEDICDQDPKECRLACMVKATGPVEVEILEG